MFSGQVKRKCIFTIMPLKCFFVCFSFQPSSLKTFVAFSSPWPAPFRRPSPRKRNTESFQIRLSTLKCFGCPKASVPDDLLSLSAPPSGPHTRVHAPLRADLGSGGTSYFLLRLQFPNPYFANIYFSEKQTKLATAYNLASACTILSPLTVCLTGHRERVQGVSWSPSWHFC